MRQVRSTSLGAAEWAKRLGKKRYATEAMARELNPYLGGNLRRGRDHIFCVCEEMREKDQIDRHSASSSPIRKHVRLRSME